MAAVSRRVTGAPSPPRRCRVAGGIRQASLHVGHDKTGGSRGKARCNWARRGEFDRDPPRAGGMGECPSRLRSDSGDQSLLARRAGRHIPGQRHRDRPFKAGQHRQGAPAFHAEFQIQEIARHFGVPGARPRGKRPKVHRRRAGRSMAKVRSMKLRVKQAQAWQPTGDRGHERGWHGQCPGANPAASPTRCHRIWPAGSSTHACADGARCARSCPCKHRAPPFLAARDSTQGGARR